METYTIDGETVCAITDIVEYLYEAEEKDYLEQFENGTAVPEHIYHDVIKVLAWLQNTYAYGRRMKELEGDTAVFITKS